MKPKTRIRIIGFNLFMTAQAIWLWGIVKKDVIAYLDSLEGINFLIGFGFLVIWVKLTDTGLNMLIQKRLKRNDK